MQYYRFIQNQMPKTDEVNIPIPEASPSIPSIRLKPLIITINTNIVNNMLAM